MSPNNGRNASKDAEQQSWSGGCCTVGQNGKCSGAIIQIIVHK